MNHLRLLPTFLVLVPFVFASAGACSDAEPIPPSSRPVADSGPAAQPDASSIPDSSSPDAAPAEFPATTAAELRATLDRVAAQIAPGAALYVHHPLHGTFEGAAGIANLETGEPLGIAHRFRAGSMLKTVVATAVLQRIEAGELTLDGTLTQLLPESVHTRIAYADSISVRMLLQHTSGIAECASGDFDALVLADPAHQWTVDELLARVEAQEPTGTPGAAWSYSNTNYVLLGEVMGAVTGRSWREVLASDVLQPLSLAHSTLPQPGSLDCADCAHGYEAIDGARVDCSGVDPSMAGAAGGAAWVTSPRDAASFLGALWAGRTYASASTRASMLDFLETLVPEEAQTGYGLGVTRFQLREHQYYGHLGGTAGYQSFMLVDPISGMVLSGYMNQRGDFAAFIVPVLESVAKLP